MSWLIGDRPVAADSAGGIPTSIPSVPHVDEVSPVKWSVLRLSAHGPVDRPTGPPYPPACSEPYARDVEKPRPIAGVARSAYFWLIHASGVTPGRLDFEASQHQSSHQKS